MQKNVQKIRKKYAKNSYFCKKVCYNISRKLGGEAFGIQRDRYSNSDIPDGDGMCMGPQVISG